MKKNLLIILGISTIACIIIGIVIGTIIVIRNNNEILVRKNLQEHIQDFQKEQSEFKIKMKELNLEIDSISFYYKTTCECNIDSIVTHKLSKRSNLSFNKSEIENIIDILKTYRNKEKNLYLENESHVELVYNINNLTNEKRKTLKIENLLIYNETL